MAGVLESLAAGLRQAGGVLSAPVQGILANEASQDQALQQKVQLMNLQRQMEMQGPEYQTKLMQLESVRAEGEKRARLGALVRTPEWAAATPQKRLEMAASQGLIDPLAMAKESVAANKPVPVGAGGLAIPDQNGGYTVIGAKPQPPTTRNMRDGDQQITQQWNPQSNSWDEIARGPAFARQVAPIVVTGGDPKAKYTNIQPDGKGGFIGMNKSTGVMEPVPSAPGISSIKTDPEKLNRKVQGLGTALEKAGVTNSDTVMAEVENYIKNKPNLISYVTGPQSALPDFAISQDARDARAAFQRVFNITLKDRSGAAVTNQELERLKQEFGAGLFKDPNTLMNAVAKARLIINNHYAAIASSFGREALDAYNENMRDMGGRVVVTPRPKTPARSDAVPPPPPGFKVD